MELRDTRWAVSWFTGSSNRSAVAGDSRLNTPTKTFRNLFHVEGSVYLLRAILNAVRIRMDELGYPPRNGSLEKTLTLLDSWEGTTPGPLLKAKLEAIREDVREESVYCTKSTQSGLLSVMSYCLDVALLPGVEQSGQMCWIEEIRAAALPARLIRKHPHPRTFWFIDRHAIFSDLPPPASRRQFEQTSFFEIRDRAVVLLQNALVHFAYAYWSYWGDSPAGESIVQALLGYRRHRTQVSKTDLETASPPWAVAWDQILEHATETIPLSNTLDHELLLCRVLCAARTRTPLPAGPLVYLAVIEQLNNLPPKLKVSILDLLELHEEAIWKRVENQMNHNRHSNGEI